MYGTVCELNTFLPGARLERFHSLSSWNCGSHSAALTGQKLLISARPGYEGLYLPIQSVKIRILLRCFACFCESTFPYAKLLSIKWSLRKGLRFRFLCIDDFGDETQRVLSSSAPGAYRTVILCDAQMHIIDCLAHTSIPAPRALCCRAALPLSGAA